MLQKIRKNDIYGYIFIDDDKSMQTYALLKWTDVHDYIKND